MAVKEILVWPNPELAKIASPVEHLDESLTQLIQDLQDTMKAGEGIGLAATQIGVHKRVIVLDVTSMPKDPQFHAFCGAMINPEIQSIGKEFGTMEEGCLSVPGQYGSVERPLEITVKYINQKAEHHTSTFTGLVARCIFHEIDHLDGKVFVQYLGSLNRDIIRRKMKKHIGKSYLPGTLNEESK